MFLYKITCSCEVVGKVEIAMILKKIKSEATGNRTRAFWVKAKYPEPLDHSDYLKTIVSFQLITGRFHQIQLFRSLLVVD